MLLLDVCVVQIIDVIIRFNRKSNGKIMVDPKKIHGERIKLFRKMLGLTLDKFAEPLSIKLGTVSDYERGKALASESVIREIEMYYRMNRNWYETGEGQMILPPDPYPHGTDKFKQYAAAAQQQRISEQLTGYSPEIRMICDSAEIAVEGRTPEERLQFVVEIMNEINKRKKPQ